MTEPAARGTGRGTSYAEAGVSIEAGDRAVALMRGAIARSTRPEVVGGVGGFAGLFDASRLTQYTRPLLATSTDGVGTKVMIAARLGRYDTIGLDLVASLLDDVVTCGAEPWFMTDYLVCGLLRPERAAAIVAGVAQGCAMAGCALIGGETAEHPGHLGADDFDLAGAATGVVEAGSLLGPDRVRAGDVVIGLAASGLHANGYSLARRVLADSGTALDATPAGLSQTIGEELLTPSTIYTPDCLALAAGTSVHALAHITGGGLAANLARVLPAGLGATLDRGSWRPLPIFGLLAGLGGIDAGEMERVFNMGVGMTAVVAADGVSQALDLLASRQMPAWPLGEVTPGDGVRLTGSHPA